MSRITPEYRRAVGAGAAWCSRAAGAADRSVRIDQPMTANGNISSDPQPTDPVTKPAGAAHVVPKGAVIALGLLLGINLFNYIDRYILSANVPTIEKDFTAA